ncbi:CBS domain-containing protein [Macrococcus brunensis]|uniref:CBS domain-containing protein n=1 Tax=Macrococcus brunensis TaxID=198483 RepID=A0A4R6BD90_9STAP|nr:CBS and ACT domain-containing protein [Macrococcus brunensis]TDL97717.1 CBS domain-containing protein [Macrococcus brunensis]ULG75117.1 CBS and ACT domain-containing protein [Macrococcus brunensis]
MLVERIMTSPCITINEERTIDEAIKLMREEDIRHLPVVDELLRVKGIITDRDVNLALPSILGETEVKLDAPVADIMNRDVMTCHPLDFVEDIAIDFHELSIGSIPVVKKGRCIGIVTQKDMLNTFLELTGVMTPGSAVEVAVPDVPGIMHEVTKVFYVHHTSIESILVYRDKENPGQKLVLIRMQSMNPRPIIDALNEAGFTVRTPLDMRL